MTEMSRLLLKPQSDLNASKAYADCFILLTKHYYDQGDKAVSKALTKTYKALIAKFLSGRIMAGAGLNIRFLQTVFERCPGLAWSLHESILKCFLPKADDAKEAEGGRSNH